MGIGNYIEKDTKRYHEVIPYTRNKQKYQGNPGLIESALVGRYADAGNTGKRKEKKISL